MKWIGLTGGIGSGKSTVAEILKKKGYSVIDADQLARMVVGPSTKGLDQVVQYFGPDILDKDGTLNRRRLGQIIFSDPQKRNKLEQILHPLIREKAAKEKARLESQKNPIAFYDVPLLFEKNMQSMFDEIVVVSCGLENQKSRMKQSRKHTDEEIEARISAQMPLAEKAMKAKYVIENDGSLKELENAIDDFLRKVLPGPRIAKN